MAQAYQAEVERLPEHMQSAARAYVEDGRRPGGFLRAVLTNDFTEAVGRADAKNVRALKQWSLWLYNDIPSAAWGDSRSVDQWCEYGGYDGFIDAQ